MPVDIIVGFEEEKPICMGLETGAPVTDYNNLANKPKINDVELRGNKSFEELGVKTMTNAEILEIYRRVF